MDPQILQKEKFAAVAELSKIQSALSEAQAALLELKDKEAEYIKEREVKTVNEIKEVLTGLKDTFQEIAKEMSALKTFRSNLEIFSTVLIDIGKSLDQDAKEFNSLADNQISKIKSQMSEIEKEKLSMKIERKRIEGYMQEIKMKASFLKDEEKLWQDRRDSLARAWGELEKKQNANK